MATRDDNDKDQLHGDDADSPSAHVDDAFRAVPVADDSLRNTHIANALDAFDSASSRRTSRVLSLAAAVLVVFGIGGVSGWAVRNNNTPAVAQQSPRTPSTTIPCHQLFPSINFVGYAAPALGETAIFLDTRSMPEAVVLVDPMTCQVVSRFDLPTPIATQTTVP